MPSAMAVLPTPASPTRIGLFLVRRERICNTRRISSSRPITGSSLPERACSLRLTAYLPSASNCCSEVCESTVAPLRKIRIASRSSFSVAPAALEDVGRLSAFGHEPQQKVFDRSIFVAEVLGEVHGALDHLRGFLRKELLAAALDPRQGADGALGFVAQSAHVHADASQQERGQRIVLADQHREQMERLDSLLSALPRKVERCLQRLLRLDGQSVYIHNRKVKFHTVRWFASGAATRGLPPRMQVRLPLKSPPGGDSVALRPDRRRKPFVINIRKTPANLIFRSLCHVLSQHAVKMRQFGATADGRAGTAEGTIFNPEFSNLRSYFLSLRNYE